MITLTTKSDWDRIASRGRLRPAYTLIELVGVMITISSIVSLTALLMHRATMVHKDSMANFRQERLLGDLHQTIRSDAQEATEAKIEDDVLLLTVGEQSIRYSLDSISTLRVRLSSSGEIIGRNQWRLNAQRLRFEINRENSVPALHFTLQIANVAADASVAEASRASASTSVSSQPLPGREIRWTYRLGALRP